MCERSRAKFGRRKRKLSQKLLRRTRPFKQKGIYLVPHLHIRASGEANSEANDDIRLVIRGARPRSGFSNTSQRGRMAISVMCTNA